MRRFHTFDRDIGGEREHHHLHHRQKRDGRAQQQRARLTPDQCLAPRGIVGPGTVTDRGDRPQHLGEFRDRRIEDHARAPRSKIHFGNGNSRPLKKPVFDEPDAGTAMDTLEQQRHVAPAVRRRAHKGRLQHRIVVVQPAIRGACFIHLRAGDVRATLVERVEPGDVDRLRDAKAPGAAEIARRAPVNAPPASGLGVLLPAVKARGAAMRRRVAARAG